MGYVQFAYYNNKNEKRIAKFRIKNDDSLELIKTEIYSKNSSLGELHQPIEVKLPSTEVWIPTKYGIGEVVASITKLFGFKPCAPCNKRRKYLNKITPNWLEKIIKWFYTADYKKLISNTWLKLKNKYYHAHNTNTTNISK
jgi:hypothetical protein